MKESSNNNEKKSLIREIFDWVFCILVAFAAAVVIKYFLFTPTLVMQTSMTPTILDGERVLINRLVRTFNMEINRGDIITFEKPDYTDDGIAKYNERNSIVDSFVHNVLEVSKVSFIKRVIGVGGDHVVIKNGDVYINDEKLDEPYLNGVKTPKRGDYSDVIVPEGYIFVMGDNRGGSSDSREFGCIPLSKVEGRVSIRLWPLNSLGEIDK